MATTTINDFQIVSKLGEGAYSSVYKVVRHSDGQEYALKKVKFLNLSEKEKLNALNEVRILASVKHPNLIAYKEAFIDDQSSSLCIVMEYCNNGDLYQKIVEHQKKGTGFPESEIWNMFIQMTRALKALHEYKIFHRDLKSANVFLNKNGELKLGDLNVSKIAKKGLLYTQTGTPYYASPEVWRDLPYDNKADVWSLGCVLYEITTLKPPFRAEDMEGLYKKVLRGYYPRIPTNFSQDLSNIIRALLQVSPNLRPSCDKILNLSAIQKRLEERHLVELEDERNNIMLSTIRVPKNLSFLGERLPKADYTPIRMRKVEKKKFLATTAGYRDSSTNDHTILKEEHVRNTESVDSYKKEKENSKMYLPPVPKEVGNKDIMKIYGTGTKVVKRDQMKPMLMKPSIIDSNESVLEGDKQDDVGSYVRKKIVANRIGYKVNDVGRDADYDKPPAPAYNIREVYGVRPVKGLPGGSGISGAGALLAGIKKNRANGGLAPLQGRSLSQEVVEHDVKISKLPPLAQDKYGKLPILHANNPGRAYGQSASPQRMKVKELGKVYKSNNNAYMEEIANRYPSVAKAYQRGRQIDQKNYDMLEAMEHDINRPKLMKKYDNDF